MVQGPSVTALEVLRNASASIDEQIDLLRQLKNDIVGHRQRKELVVRQAAVEPLVRIVSSPSSHTRSSGYGGAEGWSKADEARLQATLVLGSLASGGAAFMQPLLAANTPECLLSALQTTSQPKQLVATLQAIRGLAQQSQTNLRTDTPLQAYVIDHRSLDVFEAIFRKQTQLPQWRQLFHLASDIIIAAAVDEATKNQLLASGVWPILLDMFASAHPDTTTDLPRIISMINVVIRGSHYRAECFIHHPIIRALLPYGFPSTNLPLLLVPPVKHVNFSGSPSFPALASLQSNGNDKGSGFAAVAPPSFDISHANAVCLYLISTVKSLRDASALPALRLLGLVNNAIDAHQYLTPQTMDAQQRLRQRERYIAVCAVPIADRLIQSACEKNGTDDHYPADRERHRELKPEACDVLASLIQSSKDLQIAAVDSGAVKRICPILKKSFDTVSLTKPMWSSRNSKAEDSDAVPTSCRLGSRGMPPELDYAMRCRSAALEAIAALANREDIHRQAIVQAGVITCIIDSLKPFALDAFERVGKHPAGAKDGNTTQVIIAACHAAMSMSRSVSLLRTSLIDAGIAKPVFELLKHPMLDVRVAATEVCCNLVLEFSPMRDELLSAGVIKTLTEHARQSEMALRLSSLWALKHLVLAATREIKVQTLEELGVGWLVAAVQGQQGSDMHDGAVGGVAVNASGGLSAPNAAGERVDLLNPSSMDVDDPPANSGVFDEDEDGEVLYDEASLTHYRASNLRSTLTPPSSTRQQTSFDSQRFLDSIRDMELNPILRAQRDDIAVQEQGLDFIRNMLNGDDCAYMLEHLLNQVGSKKVFSMLTDKLAPLNPQQQQQQQQHTSSSSTRNPPPTHHPTELILSTIHVLTHIANGSPQQKSLLIAQRPLLAAWLPHFHHPDRRVRVISVWAVNSLTWIEDEHDRPAAQQRARELRGVGISAAVEALRGDVDLDVRERVRVAVRQIEGLGC